MYCPSSNQSVSRGKCPKSIEGHLTHSYRHTIHTGQPNQRLYIRSSSNDTHPSVALGGRLGRRRGMPSSTSSVLREADILRSLMNRLIHMWPTQKPMKHTAVINAYHSGDGMRKESSGERASASCGSFLSWRSSILHFVPSCATPSQQYK